MPRISFTAATADASRIVRLLLLALAWSYAACAGAAGVTVHIEGLAPPLQKNVRALLSLAQVSAQAQLSDAELRRLNAKAPAEIRGALEPFGYYRPKVNVQLQRTDGGWSVRYRVDPGPPLRIAALDLVVSGEGRDDPAFRRLINDFPVKRGAVFDQEVYRRGKRQLQQLAAERGYFDAAFTRHVAHVDLDRYSARITLHFDTGRRYRLGPVHFNPTVLTPQLLARFIPFKRGSPYTRAALLKLQNALTDSDYFESVEVQPRRDQAVGLAVPIQVTVTPRKRNRYTAGIGYGTDTGIRGTLGWESRYVNRSGHRLSAELQGSRIANRFLLRYVIPVRNPRTDRLVFQGQLLNQTPSTTQSNIQSVGVGLERTLGLWRQTQTMTYQVERYLVGEQSGHSRLLMPVLSWTRVKADDRVFTRRGSRVSIQLRGAAHGLASDTSFFQGRVDGKWIRTIGTGRLIARGTLGATWAQEFHQLPPSIRYFAGGDQSVRGYAYNDLGPTDASGHVIGGRYLVVGSLEYDHRFAERWSWAAFYDAGNALDSLRTPLARGAGVGLRWRSPVGWVRIDVARALSRPGHPWRIHFTVGPDL